MPTNFGIKSPSYKKSLKLTQRARFTTLNFKKFIISLATAWLLVCSLPAFASEITYFYDGDTVKIVDAGFEYKLRITDIDAPERNQAYGKKSRRALMLLCSGGNIYAAISVTDKYGRKLGKLRCNNQDVSTYMIQNGHAWFYDRYSMDGSLLYQQQQARANQLGLWESKKPVQPWVWRKNHSH